MSPRGLQEGRDASRIGPTDQIEQGVIRGALPAGARRTVPITGSARDFRPSPTCGSTPSLRARARRAGDGLDRGGEPARPFAKALRTLATVRDSDARGLAGRGREE